MGKKDWWARLAALALMLVVVSVSMCWMGRRPEADPPSLMHGGKIYVSTGQVLTAEPAEEARCGTAGPVAAVPSEEGETDDPDLLGAAYYVLRDRRLADGDALVVEMDREWTVFVPSEG